MPSYYSMVQALKKLPKDRKVKFVGDDRAFMVCQWHKLSDGSREHTGSFLINLRKNGKYLPGSGHCFGCEKFVKDFKVICDPALEDKEATVEDEQDNRIEPIFDPKTIEILSDEDKPIIIENTMPWSENEDWRSIKGKVMLWLKAKLIFEDLYQKFMVYLPCVVKGEHVGGIKANITKIGKRNYYNTDGSWVKERGLFPFDLAVRLMKKLKLKTIVIVEGPRDALRCIQKGIPAVAILGTGNWSDFKSDLIASIPGLERIIIAMDGDSAGKRATKKVYQSFKGEFDVFRFNFERYGKGIDPGNMKSEISEKLRSKLV